MVSSTCPFRSAQCAALIALATAAGIARIPTAATTRSMESDSAACNAGARPVRTSPTTVAFVQFLRAFGRPELFARAHRPPTTSLTAMSEAGWETSAQAGVSARQPVGECSAGMTRLRVAPVSPLAVSAPRRAELARLSSATAHHRLAYAVGPPGLEREAHRPIAGMEIPSRSAMRGAKAGRATEAQGS